MTETKHTPTPYFSAKDFDGTWSVMINAVTSIGQRQFSVATKMTKNDAEFIVRACNSHDDLVTWIEMTPHHFNCAIEASISATLCDCGRDAALAKAKEVQS